MRHRYHISADADDLDSATIHRDADCPDLDGHARPVADSTVADIDADECAECGDGEADDDREDSKRAPLEATPEEIIDDGRCPWCPDYTGDHVGRHASSAHPEAWDEYKDAT